MRFKNLFVYRLGAKWKIAAAALETTLASHALQPCGSLEMESRGWTPPQKDGQFLYTLHGQWLLQLGVEQKILPASVVRQIARDRAAELEKKHAHSIGRKQMREIRERVLDELMPRALARRHTTFAWIDPTHRWMIVDAAAPASAERLLETLGKSGADFPAHPLETRIAPASAMTGWLTDRDIPSGFTIDRDLELTSRDANKSTVRYVRHNLDGKDIQAHIAAGKTASRLGMTWNDKVSFILTENLQIKRIAFLNLLEQEPGQSAENEDEQFAVDFMLMTGELSQLLADLVRLLGGEKSHDPVEKAASVQTA